MEPSEDHRDGFLQCQTFLICMFIYGVLVIPYISMVQEMCPSRVPMILSIQWKEGLSMILEANVASTCEFTLRP